MGRPSPDPGNGRLPLALAAGERGVEILSPVATVIIGGLTTSALLEFLVRPARFWKFRTPSARRVAGDRRAKTTPREGRPECEAVHE
jgi:hypothetical protein